MISRVENQYSKGALGAREAYARKDWPALLAASEGVLDAYPTYYNFDWYKGEALYQLGKMQESIAPLQIYVRYSKNELVYPLAVDRLNTVKGAGGDAAEAK